MTAVVSNKDLAMEVSPSPLGPTRGSLSALDTTDLVGWDEHGMDSLLGSSLDSRSMHRSNLLSPDSVSSRHSTFSFLKSPPVTPTGTPTPNKDGSKPIKLDGKRLLSSVGSDHSIDRLLSLESASKSSKGFEDASSPIFIQTPRLLKQMHDQEDSTMERLLAIEFDTKSQLDTRFDEADTSKSSHDSHVDCSTFVTEEEKRKLANRMVTAAEEEDDHGASQSRKERTKGAAPRQKTKPTQRKPSQPRSQPSARSKPTAIAPASTSNTNKKKPSTSAALSKKPKPAHLAANARGAGKNSKHATQSGAGFGLGVGNLNRRQVFAHHPDPNVFAPHYPKTTGNNNSFPGKPTSNVTATTMVLRLVPKSQFIKQMMERYGYNPHLELMIRPEKRMVRVLKHLQVKWGKVSGLFRHPIHVSPPRLASSPNSRVMWNMDNTTINCLEVYNTVNRPEEFLLEYSWTPDDHGTEAGQHQTQTSVRGGKLLQQPHSGKTLQQPPIHSGLHSLFGLVKPPPPPQGAAPNNHPVSMSSWTDAFKSSSLPSTNGKYNDFHGKLRAPLLASDKDGFAMPVTPAMTSPPTRTATSKRKGLMPKRRWTPTNVSGKSPGNGKPQPKNPPPKRRKVAKKKSPPKLQSSKPQKNTRGEEDVATTTTSLTDTTDNNQSRPTTTTNTMTATTPQKQTSTDTSTPVTPNKSISLLSPTGATPGVLKSGLFSGIEPTTPLQPPSTSGITPSTQDSIGSSSSLIGSLMPSTGTPDRLLSSGDPEAVVSTPSTQSTSKLVASSVLYGSPSLESWEGMNLSLSKLMDGATGGLLDDEEDLAVGSEEVEAGNTMDILDFLASR